MLDWVELSSGVEVASLRCLMSSGTACRVTNDDQVAGAVEQLIDQIAAGVLGKVLADSGFPCCTENLDPVGVNQVQVADQCVPWRFRTADV